MLTKPAPWNLRNNNVLILKGEFFEEFALKYGVCITDNEINLVPCKYIAVYQDNVIKHLFEIVTQVLDDCSMDNSPVLKEIFNTEKQNAEQWFKKRQLCRLFIVQKIADLGPIINDFISPRTGKLTPLTCGSPRYTTITNIKDAKFTSELKCVFDDDCPDEIPVIIKTPPLVVPKKSKLPYLIASMALIILSLFLYLLLKPKPEPEIVKVEVLKTKEIPKSLTLQGSSFETGKSLIRTEAESNLKFFLRMIEQWNDYNIFITGHTDNVGSEGKNQILSESRAIAVKNWFISNGIDSSSIKYKGYGSTMPTADNSTPQGRDSNRRIEISFIPK
jgi:flagellar motor protein MotB